jgi:LysM repeat protein
MVRRWNKLKGDSLLGRRVIYVHLPVTRSLREQPARASTAKSKKAPAQDAAKVVHHKVKQGETLSSIATSYKTTVSALRRDNSNAASLRPGMILVIRDFK